MSHARVLLVDDDYDFADSLAEALRLQGHTVTVAYSAEDALRRLETQSFDISFVDFMLPGKNGGELFVELRALYPAGKVMIMTGFAQNNALKKVLDHGVLGVLDKPLDMDQVFQAIDQASPDGSVLIVDDDADFVESISEVLTASGHTVLTAACGQDAIDIVGKQAVDVMVLDLKMPDLDGEQVYSSLQSLEKLPPTIVVTGYMEQNSETLAALTDRATANALIKPFDPELLLDEVQQLVSA